MREWLRSCISWRARLHGRTRWIELCHRLPAACPVCRRAIAMFLADEVGWNLAAAIDRPTEAYQAEFGGCGCTPDQARELRRLTIEACWPGLVVDHGTIVADLDAGSDAREAATR